MKPTDLFIPKSSVTEPENYARFVFMRFLQAHKGIKRPLTEALFLSWYALMSNNQSWDMLISQLPLHSQLRLKEDIANVFRYDLELKRPFFAIYSNKLAVELKNSGINISVNLNENTSDIKI